VMEANGNLELARREVRNPLTPYFGKRRGEPTIFEIYDCLLIVDGAGRLTGAIMFPRDPSQFANGRRLYYWFEQTEDFFPMTDLPGLLRKHEGRLLAL